MGRPSGLPHLSKLVEQGSGESAESLRKKIYQYCEPDSVPGGNDRENLEARLQCSFVRLMFGDSETVIRELTPWSSQAKLDPEVHLTLAEAHEHRAKTRAQLGKTVAAEEDFLAAENSYEQALRLRQDWGALTEIGNFYFERGKFEDAYAYFQKAADLLPDEPRGQSNLANVYTYLRQPENAIGHHLKSIAQGDLESYFNYGSFRILTGECDEAIKTFEEGIQRARQTLSDDEGNHELLSLLLGTFADACRCAQQREREATASYDQALRLLRPQIIWPPDTAQQDRATRNLSLVAEWLAKRGQRDAALSEIKKVQDHPACASDCLVSSIKTLELTGDRQAALGLMRRAANHFQRRIIFFHLLQDPDFKALRLDPQFNTIIAQ